MKDFDVGDRVEWTSGSKSKTKTGTIRRMLEKGEKGEDYTPRDAKLTFHVGRQKGSAIRRALVRTDDNFWYTPKLGVLQLSDKKRQLEQLDERMYAATQAEPAAGGITMTRGELPRSLLEHAKNKQIVYQAGIPDVPDPHLVRPGLYQYITGATKVTGKDELGIDLVMGIDLMKLTGDPTLKRAEIKEVLKELDDLDCFFRLDDKFKNTTIFTSIEAIQRNAINARIGINYTEIKTVDEVLEVLYSRWWDWKP